MLRIRVLGEFSAEVDGSRLELPSHGRVSSLLAWLAIHPGMHPRSQLAPIFWPDILDASARASLRTAVWTLRQMLGPSGANHLLATRERVGLPDGPDVWVDVRAVAELIHGGRLEEALELAIADLLRGFVDEWVFAARD